MKSVQRKFISLSFIEGFFYALMVSSSESYALFFSVRQGISAEQLAIISTFPLLLGAISQWIFPQLIQPKKLLKAIIIAQGTQLLGLLGLIYNIQNGFPFSTYLLSLCLYWIGGLTCSPLWIDWMSGILPRTTFRIFLAKRNSFVVFSTLTFYLSISSIFHHFPQIPPVAIFFMGVLARLASISTQLILRNLVNKKRIFLHKVNKVINNIGNETVPSFDNLKKILWITFLWTGVFKMAVTISSPFFLPFMVHELKLSLWDYTLLTAMPLLGRSLYMRAWGRASDGIRPFLGLQVCCLFITFIPALWMASSNYTYLLGLEFASGVFWGGFELSTVLIIQNFVIQGSSKMHGIHMAIMNTFSVLGSYIGAMLLKQKFSYDFVFYFSSSMRFLICSFFVYHISKWPVTRFRPKLYGNYLITVLSLRPSINSIGKMVFPSFRTFTKKKKLKKEL